MNKNITIRQLQMEDMDALSGLYFHFWNEKSDIEKMKIKFMELRDNPRYIFLCAAEGNEITGTVTGFICDELYGQCRPFMLMDNLVVAEKHRKRGTGRALMKQLEEEAVKSDCSQIMFITESERSDAVSFYERIGYNSIKHAGFKKKLQD